MDILGVLLLVLVCVGLIALCVLYCSSIRKEKQNHSNADLQKYTQDNIHEFKIINQGESLDNKPIYKVDYAAMGLMEISDES